MVQENADDVLVEHFRANCRENPLTQVIFHIYDVIIGHF